MEVQNPGKDETMRKVYFKRSFIALTILVALLAAVLALPSVKSVSEVKVISDDKRVIVAQDAESGVNVEAEVIDPEDQELITIEDSLVPLSGNIEVEKAGHSLMGGWWLIILAIMCVAGITAYANKG